MKFTILSFLLLVSTVGFSQRHLERINFDWKFTIGDFTDGYKVDYDDSRWETVHLPHDASIAGPFVRDSLNSDRQNGFLPRQKGWYRKNLELNKDLDGKRVFIEFEGIYRDARVFVNGDKVAHQLNGYMDFIIDVTDHVSQGSNLIAVSYDNTDMESSRWYNGEGIYRDVWLLITEDVHVDYYGTYITTPFIVEDYARVNLQTEVKNHRNDSLTITLKSDIVCPAGEVLQTIINTVPFGPDELFIFRQYGQVNNPKLWDLDTPYLYKLKSSVIVDGEVTDTYETNFGIRTVEFCRYQGLLLNGRKVLAKGVNIHHDLGPLGAAAFERGFERRLEGLKKLGVNAIRLAHNPHAKFILDWCDRNGMLVVDEPFDKWSDQFFGQGNDFEKHWRPTLKAFLKRDRNHPSIIIWSAGNEVSQQRSPRYDFGVPMMKEMYDFIRKHEPSRMITTGLHPSRARGVHRTANYYRAGPPEMVFYMDVVSTNYREEFWPVDKAKYPQLIFMLSEAQVGNLGNEWFNFDHRSSVGLFYWGGTDYIGESFGWPAKGWVNGIIDWNDHWKPFSYYIHSLFADEPMVHITSFDRGSVVEKYWNEVELRYQPMFSHWNWEGLDSISVYTFSNTHEVELILNGRSLGVKQVPEEYYTKDIRGYTAEEFDPDNPINLGPPMHENLEWRIPYEPGTITAISRIDGREVARHELQTAGEPYRIVLEPDRDVINADGLDLSYITVKVVDRNGILVPHADHNITFRVTGAGSNIAVSSADMVSDESFVSDQRKVFQGKGLLVVRADQKPGTIRVRASGRGVRNANLVIEVR
ncbi:glycoside hydrolase family 2 TIM barrel-domain containing protein [Alkalitalea saponilacus]|uniref:Beta-galactosidase n=1 Tax=Alkalitalea saponilacus TaxID=889453 RepID=A0A1T5EVP0_9BACT|nr:glycoside hydrolase family 2 TIM barrel-domain containing protein [Alkalitalea saponilacus]ASB48009.1 glycoside hydrolase family 2 [Alkalitalea saponilacus]SKB87951.1 beta-galactosidase [Alkalitalea saponilacus]